MLPQELMAGKEWVERRFVEIAREFGTPRALTQEDRWREADEALIPASHPMTYYIELGGHLKRGDVIFVDADLEMAGAGGQGARERLSRHIRDVLLSLASIGVSEPKPTHAATGRL